MIRVSSRSTMTREFCTIILLFVTISTISPREISRHSPGNSLTPPEASSLVNEWNPVPQSCQRIPPASLCSDMPYNFTTLPNLVGQDDISEAMTSIKSFELLIKQSCSQHLKFFLCSVYFPMCTTYPPVETVIVIPPCRTLCNAVQDACVPVLSEFGYSWPPMLDCAKFPETNKKDQMCMPGPLTTPRPSPRLPTTPSPRSSVAHTPTIPSFVQRSPAQSNIFCQVENGFIALNSSPPKCGFLCDGNFVTSKAEKDAAEIFHGVIAGFTLLLGATVIAMYMCRSVRLSPQERPALFILGCLMMVSIGFLVRTAAGRHAVGCSLDENNAAYVAVDKSLEASACVAVFVLVYYFGLAGNLWWFFMVLMWYANATASNTKPTAMQNRLQVFHWFAWILPVIPMFTAMFMKFIDADELSGICSVGQQSPKALFIFQLLPLALIVVFGTIILILGFFVRQKKNLHASASFTDGKCSKSNSSVTDASTVRVSAIHPSKISSVVVLSDQFLFQKCLLFLISSTIVLIFFTAEFIQQEDWKITGAHGLPVYFYFIRVLMQFAYGIVLGCWLTTSIAGVPFKFVANKPAAPLSTQPPSYQVGSPYLSDSTIANKEFPPAFTSSHIYDSELQSNDYESIRRYPPTEAHPPTEVSSFGSASAVFPAGGHLLNNKLAAQQQYQYQAKRTLYSNNPSKSKDGHETFV